MQATFSQKKGFPALSRASEHNTAKQKAGDYCERDGPLLPLPRHLERYQVSQRILLSGLKLLSIVNTP